MKEFIIISIVIGVLNTVIFNMYHRKLMFTSNNIYWRISIATWFKKFLFCFVPVLNIYYLIEQVLLAWNYANEEKEFDSLLRDVEEKKIKDKFNGIENKKPSVLVMNCMCDYAIYVDGKLEHKLILNSKKNAEIIKMTLEADYENRHVI